MASATHLTWMVGRFAGTRLLVVIGKGGVGKSTIAAALGQVLAAAGPRVLLLEIDPRETFHQLFDVPPSGGAVVEVSPGLAFRNLNPRDEIDALVAEHLRLGPLVRRVLASPVYEHFVDGAPGLKELAVLGHALRMVGGTSSRRGPHFDLVVLDAPATGHGLSLLTAPSLASRVIHQGPFGRMAEQLAAFVADPVRTAAVVVTQAEEMPVQEALELAAQLRERLHREPELVVVNGLYPQYPADQVSGDRAAMALWRRRRAANEAELGRLAEGCRSPRVDLPLLALDRGPRLVAELARRLAALTRPALGGA
ncbi:MAG: ArsA family ATPase [Acidobacteriota bacterium]